MKLQDGARRFGQMLEQPAAEYAFEISIREGDLIGAAQSDPKLLRAVLVRQALRPVRRIIDGDDIVRVLASEPTAARSHIGDGLFAPEPRFVKEFAPYHFDLADHPLAGGQDVLAVWRFRHTHPGHA